MAALGFFNGVCLLPVMLSLVGPATQRLKQVRVPRFIDLNVGADKGRGRDGALL